MVGLAKAIYALGSIWAALAVTVVLLVTRWVPRRRGTARSRRQWPGASPSSCSTRSSAPTRSSGLGVNVRIGDGPVYPVVNVAIITALAFALSPYLVRPLRRIFGLVILLVSLAAMYLGAGFPADVLGGILVGFAVAALVRVAFGSPGGRPSVDRGDRRAHRHGVRREVDHQRGRTGRACVRDGRRARLG